MRQSLVAHSAMPSSSRNGPQYPLPNPRIRPGRLSPLRGAGDGCSKWPSTNRNIGCVPNSHRGGDDRDAMQPGGIGAQRHQAQHQQRAIEFQMQRPERRVERVLHRRQLGGQWREQRCLAIPEQQAVEADLACKMRERRRAAGIHRQPRRPGQGRGPQMRIRQQRQQYRGDGGSGGDRNAQAHHALAQLATKAPGRANDGVSTAPLIRKKT